MTTRKPPPENVRILAEIPQVTFPRPGEPEIQIALSYQADLGPPRTIWIPEAKLPDVAWRREHPTGPAPSADLIRRGDEARKAAIRADLEARRAAPPGRSLEL